jgi:DNA-directed RNA polymerase subunit RPC12/RpoP
MDTTTTYPNTYICTTCGAAFEAENELEAQAIVAECSSQN